MAPKDDSTPPPLRTEGDVNLSEQRRNWQAEHLDQATRQTLDADARGYLRQSLSTPCLNVLDACEGIYLVDAQGRHIIDFHGNSVHQLGYGHPTVVSAVKRELDRLPFCPRRFTNTTAIAFAEKLAAVSLSASSKVLLAPGGALAIGMALKLARYVTGRHKTISLEGSFHGASLDAISIGGQGLFRDGLGPLLPGALHVPPYAPADDGAQSLQAFARVLAEHDDIGAVIVEAIRCTTLETPPTEYWQQVRRLCDEHGALLVFDEIPWLARSGEMFCYQLYDIEPDMVVAGKGLGGAVMPLAGLIVREALDVVADRALGHYTHEKSPLAAAAGLATLRVIEEQGLLERTGRLGAAMIGRLRTFGEQHPLVKEVRGVGLQVGVVLGGRAESDTSVAEKILYRCLERGLSFKVSDGNVLTLSPPLVISEGELDRALGIVENSIRDAE